MTRLNTSGSGTRPTTDGGVDNIGAAGTFVPGRGSVDAPVPAEKMRESKQDAASARRDDSAPLGLKQAARGTPNTEPPEDNPGRS